MASRSPTKLLLSSVCQGVLSGNLCSRRWVVADCSCSCPNRTQVRAARFARILLAVSRQIWQRNPQSALEVHSRCNCCRSASLRRKGLETRSYHCLGQATWLIYAFPSVEHRDHLDSISWHRCCWTARDSLLDWNRSKLDIGWLQRFRWLHLGRLPSHLGTAHTNRLENCFLPPLRSWWRHGQKAKRWWSVMAKRFQGHWSSKSLQSMSSLNFQSGSIVHQERDPSHSLPPLSSKKHLGSLLQQFLLTRFQLLQSESRRSLSQKLKCCCSLHLLLATHSDMAVHPAHFRRRSLRHSQWWCC